jgi:hypothetical protein
MGTFTPWFGAGAVFFTSPGEGYAEGIMRKISSRNSSRRNFIYMRPLLKRYVIYIYSRNLPGMKHLMKPARYHAKKTCQTN